MVRNLLPLSALATVFALAVPGCEKTSPPPGGSATSPADGGGDGAVSPDPTPPAGDRSVAVPDDHPLFGRYEGEGFPNDCTADGDCHASGCSSEVCSADPGVITTCEVPPTPLPAGSECGCVQSQCRWWNAEGATLAAAESPPPSEPGGDCGGQVCEAPKQCIEYYGIAGAKGPKMYSCDIPCKPGKGGCPDGMKCTTIADGPGPVCR